MVYIGKYFLCWNSFNPIPFFLINLAKENSVKKMVWIKIVIWFEADAKEPDRNIDKSLITSYTVRDKTKDDTM